MGARESRLIRESAVIKAAATHIRRMKRASERADTYQTTAPVLRCCEREDNLTRAGGGLSVTVREQYVSVRLTARGGAGGVVMGIGRGVTASTGWTAALAVVSPSDRSAIVRRHAGPCLCLNGWE